MNFNIKTYLCKHNVLQLMISVHNSSLLFMGDIEDRYMAVLSKSSFKKTL